MAARHRKCPTPEKQEYATLDAAIAALRRPYKGKLKAPTRPYRCKGHYHLTSRI